MALLPFSNLSPLWGLLTVSIVTGVIMVLIFKHTSNQAAIRNTKDKISAYFLEVRLFKDDLGLMLEAQKKILRSTLTYMRYSVTPMFVMIVPVVLIMAQLGIRYSHRPLKPGESAVVKLKLAGARSVEDVPVLVENADGLQVETPLLRISGKREIDFRIRALTQGEHVLSVQVEDEYVRIPVMAAGTIQRVYPVRRHSSLTETLLSPGQSPLPENSRLEETGINYPAHAIKVLGFNANWLVIFFVGSIIAGYLLKGVFKVDL